MIPRTVPGLLLSLLLALASVEMAVARGLPDPSGEVVICRGLSVVSVTVAADGTPVRQSQLCPDATAALLGDPGMPMRLTAPDGQERGIRFEMPGLIGKGREAPRATARAPPSLL